VSDLVGAVDHIDEVATMLAHLVCADSQDDVCAVENPLGTVEDAGQRLRFEPIRPSLAYTGQIGDGDRLFTKDAGLLLQTPQDLIGRQSEIALFDVDVLKWVAFKKLYKRPRGVWVASPGADLYEVHQRFIQADGKSDYQKRVAAISKTGKPVQTIIEGSRREAASEQNGYWSDGELVVLAASIIEDSVRPGSFQATVKDDAGVIFPVPQGEHLEVFRLRDGPLSGSRRKALLHWVARHTRRTGRGVADVKAHLRGVHQFDIDGFNVTLKGAA
jgi:hypothetical protein